MKKILISLTLLAFTAVFAVGCAADDDESDGLLSTVVSVKLSIHPSDATAAQPEKSLIPFNARFLANANTPERKLVEAAGLFPDATIGEVGSGSCVTVNPRANFIEVACSFDGLGTDSSPITGTRVTFILDTPGYDPNSFFKLGYYSLFGRLIKDLYQGWKSDYDTGVDLTPNVRWADNSSYNNQTILP